MNEKFVLMDVDVIFYEGAPHIRYIGFIEETDENFMFYIDFDFWNQLYYEFDSDEKLVDDICIKYAMDARGHYNINIERGIES